MSDKEKLEEIKKIALEFREHGKLHRQFSDFRMLAGSYSNKILKALGDESTTLERNL